MRSFQILRNATVVSAVVFGLALAGCGGGSSSSGLSAMPGAGQPNTSAQSDPTTTSSTQLLPTDLKTAVATAVSVGPKDHVSATPVGPAHLFLSYKAKQSAASAKAVPYSIVYPGDLQYFGGKVLTTARVYNAFVNSNGSSFGYPNNFEEHFSYSKMIHIMDQYVGATGNNRYDWAGDAQVSYPTYTTLGDNDIVSILHAVASYLGPNAGTKNIYNVFLPQGVDYCGTGFLIPAGECNASITSPAPYFCGFHEAIVFADIGEVLFTLQPYQDLDFCAANFRTGGTTPNGPQNDSTYSTLSHEISETITDPEPGTGWYDNNAPAVSGEIGDLCAYLGEDVTLAGKAYYIQREYSNKVHGCTNSP